MILQSCNLGDSLQFRQQIDSEIIEIDPKDLSQRRYTSQQLESIAQSIASYLFTKGYGPTDHIAIVSGNSLEFIACYLGILKLGAVVMLINAKSSKSQIVDLLQKSNAKFVFSDQQIDIDVPVVNLNDGLEKILVNNFFESYQPDKNDTAVILHTSGSTGYPKRVSLTHHARTTMRWVDDIKQRICFAGPFFHNMGINFLDANLYNKNDLIFLKYFDPAAYLTVIDQHRPTRLLGVPSIFERILIVEKKLLKTLDLSSVRHITLAGSATSESLYNRLQQLFNQAMISIGYGTSETGPTVFGLHTILLTPPGSVGCERPDVALRLVDGVLQVRSPYMIKSHDNNNYEFTKDGYYITNDVFRVDENGFYYFIGRSDDMFKSGGNKLFPSEIEQVVEQHPAVDKCVVIPITDPIKDYKPYAFVTVKENINEDTLICFLSDKLARYQMPRQIWIIDRMPLTVIGKIDKNKLKILAEQKLNI
jgi:acyl-coenzyme A synthetase/AMP-(fatty) acid ligase